MYRTKHLRHQFIHLFDNISEGDIKGFIFNITQKFTNLLVQLSIFLIYLFVGTYMSSHCGGITPCIEWLHVVMLVRAGLLLMAYKEIVIIVRC